MAALLAALTVMAGCTDDVRPISPGVPSCIVQGTVSQFDGEAVRDVRLRRIVPYGQRAEFTVQVSGYGTYRAEVPAGDYIISLYTFSRTFYYTVDDRLPDRSADADTVRLDLQHSPVTADFRFGAVHLDAPAPAVWGDADIEMVAYRLDDPYFAVNTTATITDGRCDLTLSTLPEGDYQIQFWWERDYRHVGGIFWLPGYRSRAEAQVYHVAPDSVINEAGIFASSPPRLVGQIGGAWRDLGLDPPSVVAVDTDSVVVFGRWQTEADGSFDLALPYRGPVRLKVTRGVVESWVGGLSYGTATLFAPEPGEIIDGIAVTGGGLRLRVNSSGLTQNSESARLTFQDPQDPSRRVVTSGSLASQIGIANLPQGDWLLLVEPDSFGSRSWRPQWLDRSATAAGATVLSIPADGVVTADLVLEAGGAIRGQVVRPPGESFYVYVAITDTQNNIEICSRYVSGSRDDFAITGLNDGSYRIGILPGGVGPVRGEPVPEGTLWYPGTTDWATAGVITINDAGNVAGLVLTTP